MSLVLVTPKYLSLDLLEFEDDSLFREPWKLSTLPESKFRVTCFHLYVGTFFRKDPQRCSSMS
jgi:hypothetical protein